MDTRAPSIKYYDSMGGYNQPALYATLKFLKAHYQASKGLDLPTHTYVLEKGNSPIQENSYDCGVFMMKTIECLSRDSPLSYKQSDIPHIR